MLYSMHSSITILRFMLIQRNNGIYRQLVVEVLTGSLRSYVTEVLNDTR